MPHAILTAIGSDRPGIVDELSQFIFDRGGNIEDSRMVNLHGQFAMMVLVGGPDDTLARLTKDLSHFSEKSGMNAALRDAEAPKPRMASANALPYRLVGTGIDQPGLVHKLTHVLREMNVNIENLESRLTPAPYTGSPMFEIEAILSVPRTTQLSQLRQQLSAACDALNMDWDLGSA